MVTVFVKNITQYVLAVKGYQMILDGSINVNWVLDFSEVFITIYVMYNMHVFTLCLQTGIIREYQPLRKFYWFAFLTFCIVI